MLERASRPVGQPRRERARNAPGSRLMAHLRCTSCDRRFSRSDAVRSEFKCPQCGGLALFDWTEDGPGDQESVRPGRSKGVLGRWLRRRTG